MDFDFLYSIDVYCLINICRMCCVPSSKLLWATVLLSLGSGGSSGSLSANREWWVSNFNTVHTGLRMLIPGNSTFLEKVFAALTGQKGEEYESGRVFVNGLYPQALIIMTPIVGHLSSHRVV